MILSSCAITIFKMAFFISLAAGVLSVLKSIRRPWVERDCPPTRSHANLKLIEFLS